MITIPDPSQRLYRLDLDYTHAPDLLARLAMFPPGRRPMVLAACDRAVIRVYLWPRGMTGYEMVQQLSRYFPIPVSPFTLMVTEARSPLVCGRLIERAVQGRLAGMRV